MIGFCEQKIVEYKNSVVPVVGDENRYYSLLFHYPFKGRQNILMCSFTSGMQYEMDRLLLITCSYFVQNCWSYPQFCFNLLQILFAVPSWVFFTWVLLDCIFLVGTVLPFQFGSLLPLLTGSRLPLHFHFEWFEIEHIVDVRFIESLLFPVNIPMFF